jgi:hypothetical protein
MKSNSRLLISPGDDMSNAQQTTVRASSPAASQVATGSAGSGPAAANSAVGSVRRADDDADYARLRIDRKVVAPWEDGQRESTARGHFEWWYFDAHLDDGATVVVAFYTKPTINPDTALTPLVTINLTLPDGRIIDKTYRGRPDDFAASKDRCDVTIGAHRFVGDLHRYRIDAAIDDVSVTIDLIDEVGSWRPKSGHTYYAGSKGEPEELFAWLVAVPQGRVTIDYQVGGTRMKGTGIGYHDHNWGDAPMLKLLHDWYWARAKIGPYCVVTSYVTAQKDYGYTPQTVFFLAKDGTVVAEDERKVTFATDRISTDQETGKPVADITRYTYVDGNKRYVVTFERERTILRQVFADKLSSAKRALAKVAGVDSAYLRFTGKAAVEKFEGDRLVERFSGPAIWELMYLGQARPPAV